MTARTPRRRDPHARFAWLFGIGGSSLALFLIGPVWLIVWRALRLRPDAYLGELALLQALLLSVVTSTLATALTVGLGTPLAYIQARWTWRYRAWLDTLTDLPIVLPPSVAGLGLLLLFGRGSGIGRILDALFNRSLPFTTTAVVLAQLFVAAPLYIKAARIGFSQIDAELEESAVTEGAAESQVFRYVLLPLSRNALLGGVILSWARALGEFGATLMFAGNLPGRTQTMPLAIYLGLESNLPTALVLAAILIMTSVVALYVLRRLERAPE